MTESELYERAKIIGPRVFATLGIELVDIIANRPHNWLEDYSKPNSHHVNRCGECHCLFIGLETRKLCRVCGTRAKFNYQLDKELVILKQAIKLDWPEVAYKTTIRIVRLTKELE